MAKRSKHFQWSTPAYLLVLLNFLTALNFLQAAKPSSSANLETLGFNLLQSTPIDFELRAIGGSLVRLKDFRGKWIFLAFWATWCGPCTEEIPQLESLYRKFKKDGFSVIAVSVDQDRSPVEAFKGEKGISFPILHDADGAVASKYRASALPTLYAISPDWKLVGVLRGARDWTSSEVFPSMAELLGHREYKGKNPGIKMVEEDGGLTLPNNLVPPILSIDLPVKDIKLGASVPLTVGVTWKGDPKDYLIKVPKLTLPEGITQGDVSSSSTSENENTRLQYHFPLKIEKEGSLRVGPVELAYSPRVGGKELFSRNEGLTIEVKKKESARVWIAAVSGIAVLLTFTLWITRRRQPKSEVQQKRDWREPYERVRQLKMRGRKDEYMTALLQLNLEIDEGAGTKNLATLALLEKIRFGGSPLSETELLGFEKKVERAINNQSLKAEES